MIAKPDTILSTPKTKTMDSHPDWSIRHDEANNAFHLSHKASGSVLSFLQHPTTKHFEIRQDGKRIGRAMEDKDFALKAFKNYFHSKMNDPAASQQIFMEGTKVMSKNEKVIEDIKALIKHLEAHPEEEELLKGAVWERTNVKQKKDNANTGAVAGEQKGVHRPATGASSGEIFSATKQGVGTSHAGMEHRRNPSFKDKEKVKDTHKKIIAEQKAMPRPNLPKSEIMASIKKCGDMIAASKAKKSELEKGSRPEDKNIKGVHTADTMNSDPRSLKGGVSKVGRAKEMASRNGWVKPSKFWDHDKQSTIAEHKAVQSEAKKIKPNLPKSEKVSKFDMAAGVASKKPPSPSPSLAEQINFGGKYKSEAIMSDIKKCEDLLKSIKGVHKPASNHVKGQGTSEVGADVKMASSFKVPSKRFDAKGQHQKVIAEQKAMPRPSLPKDEMAPHTKGNKYDHPMDNEPSDHDVQRHVYQQGVAHPNESMGTSFRTKGYHRKLLKEIQGMKKPNLPKAEFNYGAQKIPANVEYHGTGSKQAHAEGIATSSTARKLGQSDIGAMVRSKTSDAPMKRKAAKEQHKQILGEMKGQKPNLPKSEPKTDDILNRSLTPDEAKKARKAKAKNLNKKPDTSKLSDEQKAKLDSALANIDKQFGKKPEGK